MGKAEIADVLYSELCTAIENLAKSVEIAVKHLALRAEFTATIADADKVERAARVLQSAALSSIDASDTDFALVPEDNAADAEETDCTALVFNNGASSGVHAKCPNRSSLVPEPLSEKSYAVKASPIVDELYEACDWLSKVQTPNKELENGRGRKESAIAERVLALHDRFNWSIK